MFPRRPPPVGSTLSNYAAGFGPGGADAYLVANGTDLTAKDEDGKTPLQHAMGRESSPEALALSRSHRAAE